MTVEDKKRRWLYSDTVFSGRELFFVGLVGTNKSFSIEASIQFIPTCVARINKAILHPAFALCVFELLFLAEAISAT